MAKLTIQLPDIHTSRIAEAVAAVYGVEPTAEGIKKHLLHHLRRTVLDHARQGAVDQATEDLAFGVDWDDLEKPPDVGSMEPD